MKRAWPAVIAALAAIILLEFLSAVGWINPALVPPPHDVINALIVERAEFTKAFMETALATFIGFICSISLGFSLAMIFSFIPWLRRAILPFAIFFQTVPIIAIAPLLVIYFGFGLQTVAVASLVVSIFPVLANTLLGLESTDPGFLELMDVYKATRFQKLIKIRLPAAYPSIYGGLKIAAGLSVIGSVAGEFVAGGGLGAIIDSARTQQRIDLVFGALVLLSVLGLLLIAAIRLLHKIINAWRPYGLYIND